MNQKSLSAGNRFGLVLARIFLAILGVIITLLVVLLPLATVVPVYIWLPLAAANLAIFILLFTLKPAAAALLAALAGFIIVGTAAVLVSQFFAMTPPILGADGKPLPTSIASLEQVKINGSRQWISIRGEDVNHPVLLFLAGGPGGSQLSTARFALQGLEKHFVVVNWEQPGAGKSFDALDRRTLTVDRYIEDMRALTIHLQERFDEEKIYILGESWGSALGILAAQRYPDLYHAFAGTGQMVAFLENDQICYDFALNWARERGDTGKVDKLLAQGPPPYYGKGVAMKQAAYLMDTFNYMNSNPAIQDNGFNTFRDLAAPEYGLYDKLNWFRGVLDTLGVVYPQLWDIDFRQQAAALEVPVYFLIGRHDINAPVTLTEDYYEIPEAPHKEIVWFEKSGHNPWVSESDKFVEVMVEKLLKTNQ